MPLGPHAVHYALILCCSSLTRRGTSEKKGIYGPVAGKRQTRHGAVHLRTFEHRFSVRRPKQRGDENEMGNDSSPLDFDAERSNSSARLTVAATSFEIPEAHFGDHEGLRFVIGVSRVFTRTSPFLSILLTRRDCLLANLSALGSEMRDSVDVLCFSGRPMCGSEPRENTGAATSSLPPFFDRVSGP